ncbi:hypothetical protein [Acidocella sp.]|uniref:hypothetical protein n=1 Tax=Acidocella sp. TaxID=50710 RepID=UPI0026104F9B|nr:hypothetical protein [Acidocella sp.]
MGADHDTLNVREAVGVFANARDIQDAIDELLGSGFDRVDLSLLASEHVILEKFGYHYKNVSELIDNSSTPRSCYISTESIGDAEGGVIGGLVYVGAVAAAVPIIASGGSLAAAFGVAALSGGVGGLIGSVLAKFIGDHHEEYIQEQLDHGGLLLWVRAWNEERERSAIDILTRHSGKEVHVHVLPAIELENWRQLVSDNKALDILGRTIPEVMQKQNMVTDTVHSDFRGRGNDNSSVDRINADSFPASDPPPWPMTHVNNADCKTKQG